MKLAHSTDWVSIQENLWKQANTLQTHDCNAEIRARIGKIATMVADVVWVEFGAAMTKNPRGLTLKYAQINKKINELEQLMLIAALKY